ncbi:hypothetical protein DXX93_05690 [Thalassotalea euphylliae]|uniref:Uncharacterized protein n=1 Tax=Thalassotalea euphylliae TaxID=1655234 RepID=A0A3E0TNN6_9GAMM|nr:putative capsular polysaccharide synthesis family protein [Thalassotalea euphylliae]REL26118.1 hypothetical protein DXX93_05690 [Thalassotalea euphylliae]
MLSLIKAALRRVKRHKVLIDKYKDPDTVFVYQMGKVGSTALESAIPEALHVHAFYNKNHTCPVRLKGLAKFGFKHIALRLEQELIAFLIRRAFRARSHTKIITLVRDAKQRNISMFFHDIDAYLFAAHTNCISSRRVPIPTRNQSKQLLATVFEDEFNHAYPLTWFDNELLPMTGIDMFQHTFDKENGVQRIQANSIDLLCIRMDKLSANKGALEEFIGREVALEFKNDANSKWYAELYQSFKSTYQYPEELAKSIDNSPFQKHFFD